LTRGATYTFVGSAIDFDQGPAAMPCSALRWTSSKPGDHIYTGCTPTVTFSTVGLRKIKLTATDPQGDKGTATVAVKVIAASLQGPPHPSILKPFSGQRINVKTSTTLEASLGAGADPPVSVKWTLLYNGAETTLGTTNPLTWTPPGGSLPATACSDKLVKLKVYVTDKDGTGTDTVNVVVGYPPC
jgi:hypothetical protein